MSVMLKKVFRLIAPSRHPNRVWQRHSALLTLAARQPAEKS